MPGVERFEGRSLASPTIFLFGGMVPVRKMKGCLEKYEVEEMLIHMHSPWSRISACAAVECDESAAESGPGTDAGPAGPDRRTSARCRTTP